MDEHIKEIRTAIADMLVHEECGRFVESVEAYNRMAELLGMTRGPAGGYDFEQFTTEKLNESRP